MHRRTAVAKARISNKYDEKFEEQGIVPIADPRLRDRRCTGTSGRFVEQQFFPSSDRPELIVDWNLPQNASIEETDAEMARFEREMLFQIR